jgi:hypothetical protein
MSDLQNREFVSWSEQQARRRLKKRVRTIAEHLIRIQASPATHPKAGWQRTVVEQRDELGTILDDSPSLKPIVAAVIAAELPVARQLAALALEEYGETPSTAIDQINYTEEQVLGPWLP